MTPFNEKVPNVEKKFLGKFCIYDKVIHNEKDCKIK